MKTKLNIAEILKDCPKGTKLWSPMFGEVTFRQVYDYNKDSCGVCCIYTLTELNEVRCFTKHGLYFDKYKNSECLLFPSKENRDWSKFKTKKPKFDIKTLQPFDRVLVKCLNNSEWLCNIFSHIEPHSNFCFCANDTAYKICIPYNDETKHLVGTVNEAPEFYRYWED